MAFDSPIEITFTGLDAERHTLEIEAFATSLKGFGRVISVAAQFAATQKHIQHKDAMDVRVVVAPPHEGSVTISAIVQFVGTNPFASATASALLVALIAYIFKRAAGQREEMKLLGEALQTAIRELGNRDQRVITRLLKTVDKMSDSLKPAARQAVSPIGRTAARITVSDNAVSGTPLVLGKAERDAIEADEASEILPEQTFEVLFVEMNHDRNTCRVAFPHEEKTRAPAEISDPLAQQPNNPYALAFAAKKPIHVRAKAMIADGIIAKLYISDVATAGES